MSIQSARDFLAKVANDDDFRTGLIGCKTKADQLKFAQGAGFVFSVEEIETARSELQDLDLAGVSGGSCCFGCDQDYGSPGCTTLSLA